MTECIHCGTPFPASCEDDHFCCKGCEFVYDLICAEGFDRYYTLRQDKLLKPVRSVPFETHDFSWLAKRQAEIEVGACGSVEGDFSLDGISCIGCVWLVERLFLRMSGALEAAAHPAAGRVHLRWNAGALDLTEFARELVSFGYTLVPRSDTAARSDAGDLGAKLGLCGAFMLNAMGFTLPSYLGMPASFQFNGVFQLVVLGTATLSMLVGGSYFITRAWQAARMKMLHIDLPIALGLIAAYLGSIAGWAWNIHGLLYFDFVSTFVFLMLGGRYLQLAATEKNRKRLRRHRPVPETMTSPDRTEPLALSDLAPGLRFDLQPGQAIPVAATLDHVAADFSLEWISGEAESQTFHAGRRLPAGAIYFGAAPVTLTARETWSESLLAKLVAHERIAVRIPALERLLKFYLIAVLCVGTAAFAWWLKFHDIASALQVLISVFVVSCPCALGVSLPMADEIAGSMMEKLGVFIRQPLLWARLRKVKTVVFDKTGTLTMERPVLMNATVVEILDAGAKLALARLTDASLHPVSRSLLESLGLEGRHLLRESSAVAVKDVPGQGRYYESRSDLWSLGRPGWASAAEGTFSIHDAELCYNGECVARFLFRESWRADAVDVLGWLREKGFRRVILSGDRKEKVTAAAEAFGIPEADAHAALLPEMKEEIVRALDRRDTLYLGDGANDSLAFNAAWTTGTPVVDRSLLEAKADFYFMGNSLRFLPQLLMLAQRRQTVARVAFGFALAYNLTAVALCLGGKMSPLLAAILMPLSSVISLAIVGLGMRWSSPAKPGIVNRGAHRRSEPEGTLLSPPISVAG